MRVEELSRDQKVELKQEIICSRNDAFGIGTSWDELAAADDIISDTELYSEYSSCCFCDGDFFCSAF